MYFHVWFSVKYRMDALQGENREIVLASFSDVAKTAGINLMEAEALHDHAHLLVEVQDDQTLPQVIKRLKGASAREVLDKVPLLRVDMHSNSFWQRGYGSRLIASVRNTDDSKIYSNSGRPPASSLMCQCVEDANRAKLWNSFHSKRNDSNSSFHCPFGVSAAISSSPPPFYAPRLGTPGAAHRRVSVNAPALPCDAARAAPSGRSVGWSHLDSSRLHRSRLALTGALP